MNEYNSDEIDLKQLGKKVLLISKNRKKIFTTLLIVILSLSALYFLKVMLMPKYKGEVILKSGFVRKEQLKENIDIFNDAINENDSLIIGVDLYKTLIKNNLIRFEIEEIKSDIATTDKDDKTKYYKFKITFIEKPTVENQKSVNKVVDYIKYNISINNDIVESKKLAIESIAEMDTLVNVAFEAGNLFKNKMNMPGNLMVMNDLYKSLNDILAKKAALKSQLVYLQTENLIFQVSPMLVTKSISFPTVIFAIGILIWLIICIVWISLVLVFGED